MSESPPAKKQVLRQVDDEALALAQDLLRNTPSGALGSLDPIDGTPFTSLITVATDSDGSPLILISTLSTHTQALLQDARCSVLLAQTGTGDPLAHPRMTVVASAQFLERDSEPGQRAARRFLARHDKARMYADFADFSYVRLAIERASLNGGFGKAYELAAADLLCDTALATEFSDVEAEVLAHMNSDHTDAIQNYATKLAMQSTSNWRLTGIDPNGVDMASSIGVCRLAFDSRLQSTQAIRPALIEMAKQARAA